jgi:hypothetical protein
MTEGVLLQGSVWAKFSKKHFQIHAFLAWSGKRSSWTNFEHYDKSIEVLQLRQFDSLYKLNSLNQMRIAVI